MDPMVEKTIINNSQAIEGLARYHGINIRQSILIKYKVHNTKWWFASPFHVISTVRVEVTGTPTSQ